VSLLDTADARALITTALTDVDLETVIDREEAEMIRLFGPHGDGTITTVETVEGKRRRDLLLSRPIASVTSVVEYLMIGDPAQTLTTAGYFVWPGQGRLTRLPTGTCWGAYAIVTYAPANDQALRQSVLIDLLRLTLTRRAASSWMEERHADTVGKTDSVTMARSWDQERHAILQRLTFIGV
jgi:hypothetical protein